HSQTALVVVLDTSGSMGLKIFGKTIFDDSLSFLKNYVSNFSERDQITILNSDRNPRVIFNGRKNELENSFEEFNHNDNSANLNNALNKGISILNNSEFPNKEILILSDFQKNSISSQEIKKTEHIKIYSQIFNSNLQKSQITNAGIISADINPTLSPDNTEVQIEIRNKTEKAIKTDVIIRNPEKIFEQSIDLPGNTGDMYKFIINSDMVEEKYLEFLLTQDDLENDNYFYRIERKNDSFDIGILSRNADVKFISLAVDPYPGNPGRSPYSATLISPEELNPEEYPVCILLDLQDYSDSVEFISKYLNAGGSLLIFFGTIQDIENFNKNFTSILNLRVKENISAVKTPLKIDKVDTNFTPFNFMSRKENGSLNQADFYSLVSFEKENDVITLAESTGSSVITTGRKSPGQVILFGFLPDRSMSNLPFKPIFLPFIHNLLNYKTFEQKSTERNEFIINDNISVPLKEYLSETEVSITGPGFQQTLKEEVRHIKNMVFVSLPELQKTGFYSIQYQSSSGKTSKVICINPNPAEAELEYYSIPEVRKIIPDINFITSEDYLERNQKTENQVRGKTDLTITILIIVFFLLIAELLFSNYISKQEKQLSS
ncbi:MAG: VWA domain-containing protein, partial [bacterium]|nr:VWA domain-containing protein [bacterium]